MNFQTEAHQQCYEKVAQWMKEMFGEQVMVVNEAPLFAIALGSSLTQVGIGPWGNDDATITTMACVVSGVELTPQLMRFLLEENRRMRFGAFGLDEDGDIFFGHTIVGSTCDKEELKSSVFAVARVADDYDDKISSRYGGERAADKFG